MNTDVNDNLILELLRAIRTDIGEIKAHLIETKEHIGLLEQHYSSMSRRVDCIGGGLKTIKHRLDLVDAV